MNKSARTDSALPKPPSREFAKIKDKLRSHDHKLKQYESMCETEQPKADHSLISFNPKNSKKGLKSNHSSGRLSRSKSRTLERSIKKHSQQKPQKAVITDLYSELMAVKSEYNTLKQSYNKLVVEKNELTEREQTEKEAIQIELGARERELERYQRLAQGYEQQMERVKRECYRLIQIERLKQKKLEETIQEKDLMIAFLRSEVEKTKRNTESTSTNHSSLLFLHSNPHPINLEHSKPSHSQSNVIVEEISYPSRQKVEEDSLSFSRDKSKEMDSIHSFLTAQDQSVNLATRKDIVVVQNQSTFPENESDQCLTFEHRGEEETEEGLRSSLKPLKSSLISDKSKKSHNLPPKNIKIKCTDMHKKERTQTDENKHFDMNKNDLTQSKKCLNSSISSRKKTSSKRKKI